MIDINKMRRLAKEQEWIGRWYDAGCETLMAERNGEHEEVAHPIPIGLVPYLIAVQPASILELLDRLEAAEKERDNANAASVNIALEAERLQCENDALRAALRHEADCVEAAKAEIEALRAKVEAMVRQEPVAWARKLGLDVPSFGCVTDLKYRPSNIPESSYIPLYALPGAQPAPSAPDVDALAQFIREIDGKHQLGAGALAERIVEWLAAVPEAKP